jgi:hypothetical protein
MSGNNDQRQEAYVILERGDRGDERILLTCQKRETAEYAIAVEKLVYGADSVENRRKRVAKVWLSWTEAN